MNDKADRYISGLDEQVGHLSGVIKFPLPLDLRDEKLALVRKKISKLIDNELDDSRPLLGDSRRNARVQADGTLDFVNVTDNDLNDAPVLFSSTKKALHDPNEIHFYAVRNAIITLVCPKGDDEQLDLPHFEPQPTRHKTNPNRFCRDVASWIVEKIANCFSQKPEKAWGFAQYIRLYNLAARIRTTTKRETRAEQIDKGKKNSHGTKQMERLNLAITELEDSINKAVKSLVFEEPDDLIS